MVQIQPPFHRSIPRYLLIAAAMSGVCDLQAERFYPDDPIRAMPKPRSVGKLPTRKTELLYDFLKQSFSPKEYPPVPAQDVNTLGDVPDSEWFTNRHAVRRPTREELQRGPGAEMAPIPPFQVVAGKTEGITPGFRMRDTRNRLYFVKPDPITNPEMATAADVIGSRFFYALGYNTPQNYIVNVRREDLQINRDAKVDGPGGQKRPMSNRDIEDILREIPRRKDGSYRLLASLAVSGQPIGPFRYEGVRLDDPNDTIPHQNRRELRGLDVFCAWLNHTDAKAGNSLDTVVEEGGLRYVRHHLIDFGAILGSDSDMAKNARYGHEYIIPTGGQALGGILSMGLYVKSWESADYGGMKAIGRFESNAFDPEKWKSNYPNPAFLRRLPGDEYWAAKQVMAFTDDDIRAIVETGQYSSSEVVDRLTKVLAARRDKIGRAYFAKVIPFDNFSVANGELRYEDLAAKHGFAPPRQLQPSWFRVDNKTGDLSPIAGATGFRLPAEVASGSGYFAAQVQQDKKSLTVFIRAGSGRFEIAGAERQ